MLNTASYRSADTMVGRSEKESRISIMEIPAFLMQAISYIADEAENAC
ncbi:hypothetical protein [Aneurinibacillus migulanus]|jgi:hypothetical protein|uniref:Uncharacterized protein n=1 Tax=Aneurinibacillus migulanus TaxID=47500 RepID=A0A1G8I0F7_ANEMI|nr:hypothetical protein [Aneurinibacillus migulanus]MCP1354540.1 hypothetical protein [Aneurinibacillus migulanus]MED0892961.1 hypothetical protein [Aneurinibacillus migulanus]MED1614725.1 hypothetical protein [Aneurinibacillus migulanus]MED4729048.1 hypothetical protein [Aneurinibacillus migulanus]SDI12373.1 hypothetical protein SAMN04487909_101622 [Aneurinibacillus migulanus]